MIKIEDLYCLVERGLDIAKSGQYEWWIFRPNDVYGNFIEGYERNIFGVVEEELELTAVLNSPIARLFEEDGKYHFMVWDYVPGPGSGDFDNEFESLEACLNDVVEYYKE